MKAAVYYETGAPEVLKYEDVPDPVCFSSGIVIKVEAIAIEGGDVLNRFRGEMPSKPHIVGYQAAGEVIEVGADVSGFRKGDKVATVGAFGSHAEKRLVHERTAWKIPAGYDVRRAAAIPVTFGTADDCLFEFGRLKAGETVLVQAG
jgi:NADPH:quinone reductase